MAIKYADAEMLKKELGKGIQIVNFTAEWCPPCQMMKPVFEDIAKEADVFKVDIDKEQYFAAASGIKNIPTTFVYKDGQLVNKVIGFAPKEEVLKNI